MAKQRIVNTKFWDDSYIGGLTPLEKLVFLYLITNPLTNISGVYELPLKRAAFDVGEKVEAIETIFKIFEADGKLLRIVSALVILVFFAVYCASGIVARARLFESVFGLPYAQALWWGAAATVLYTLIGGFLAVSWTDTVQATLMIFALILNLSIFPSCTVA